MSRRLRTVLYHADDLQKVKAWYAQALGVAPYVDERYYVGFRVGDTELGLDPNGDDTPGGNAGAVALWEVDDVQTAVAHLTGLGAALRGDVQQMDSVRVATLLDPFNNILGVIQYIP